MEGLLSTGPTPSSFKLFSSENDVFENIELYEDNNLFITESAQWANSVKILKVVKNIFGASPL